jgi:predicted dehydrogenase
MANARTELVGLVEQNSELLEKVGTHYGVPPYTDLTEALRAQKPDICIIATPPSTHEQILKVALEHQVPAIVCEKPVSVDAAGAGRMIEMAQKAEAIVLLNHQRRFFPLYKEARMRIAAGELGKIVKATGHYSKGLLNNGSHLIDIVFYLLRERHTSLELIAHDDSEEIHDLTLEGSKGVLTITHYGYEFKWPGETKVDKRSMLEPTIAHIVECLDGTATPLCTLEDGLKTLRVIERLESGAKSQIISI